MAWKNEAELLHAKKQVGEQKLLLPHIPCYGIRKRSLFRSHGDGQGQNSAAAALSHSCKDGTQHHTCCPAVCDCKKAAQGPCREHPALGAGGIRQQCTGSAHWRCTVLGCMQQPRQAPQCCQQGTEQCITLYLIPPRSTRGGSPCGLHGGPVASQRGSCRAPGTGFHLCPRTLRSPPRCQGEGTTAPAPPVDAAQGRGFLTVPGSPPVGLVNGTFDVYLRHLSPSIKASGITFHHGGALPSLRG